jgi:hypothetical protein
MRRAPGCRTRSRAVPFAPQQAAQTSGFRRHCAVCQARVECLPPRSLRRLTASDASIFYAKSMDTHRVKRNF